jgi:hypothetical protein
MDDFNELIADDSINDDDAADDIDFHNDDEWPVIHSTDCSSSISSHVIHHILQPYVATHTTNDKHSACT